MTEGTGSETLSGHGWESTRTTQDRGKEMAALPEGMKQVRTARSFGEGSRIHYNYKGVEIRKSSGSWKFRTEVLLRKVAILSIPIHTEITALQEFPLV